MYLDKKLVGIIQVILGIYLGSAGILIKANYKGSSALSVFEATIGIWNFMLLKWAIIILAVVIILQGIINIKSK